jgi:hypothetical protein
MPSTEVVATQADRRYDELLDEVKATMGPDFWEELDEVVGIRLAEEMDRRAGRGGSEAGDQRMLRLAKEALEDTHRTGARLRSVIAQLEEQLG